MISLCNAMPDKFYHQDIPGIINLCFYHNLAMHTYTKCNIKVNKLVFKTKN